MSLHPSIIDHWHSQCDDLQLSSNDFYATIEKAIEEKGFPHVNCNRKKKSVDWYFSEKREYLAISFDKLEFLLCAAPFGRSYFFSWYLTFDYGGIAMVEWIPLIGKGLAKWAMRKTYFEIDTEIMFRESIKAIVNGAIAEVERASGVRTEQTQPSVA